MSTTAPRIVSWDTETRGLSWSDPNERAFLATWADEDGEYHADLSDPVATKRFLDAVTSADILVAHNAAFDLHQVRATLGVDLTELGIPIHDTDLLSRVVYPEGQRGVGGTGHGLKGLAKVFLRVDAGESEDAIKEMGKAIGLRTMRKTGAYYEVWRAYPEVMEEYARQDARFTYDLFEKFSANVGDLQRVYDLEMAVLPVLLRAEKRGTRTDQAAVSRLKTKFTEELEAVSVYLREEFGEAALGGEGSDDALTEALLAIGVPLHEKTDTGKLATNKFALQPFANDFPQIEALFEFRKLERFLSTYIGPMDGVEVIHPSFWQCGAWTGRMSCSKPNMQNWPKRAGKEVRSVLVPREGHAFVVCDYESIEIRVLAYYLFDSGFQELIAGGHDPYSWVATCIWGGSMEQFAKDGPNDAFRSLAKAILLAICYGAGVRRVSVMLRDAKFECDDYTEEARSIISKIKTSLPNYFKLNKRVRAKIESLGHVNTLFGRKQIVKKDKAYVGLNALIQGSAADIMKQGLVNVDRLVTPLGAIPLLVVHDEVVVECPVEHAEECLALTKQGMIEAYDLTPRLSVSGSITTTSYADA